MFSGVVKCLALGILRQNVEELCFIGSRVKLLDMHPQHFEHVLLCCER